MRVGKSESKTPAPNLERASLKLFVESRIGEIDIFLVHPLLGQGDSFANTINMKWITKEPPTLFFNGILTNLQLFCAFIKVPLQPNRLNCGFMINCTKTFS